MQIVVVKKPQPIESVIITLSEQEAIYLKSMMHQLKNQYVFNGAVDALRLHIYVAIDKELTP